MSLSWILKCVGSVVCGAAIGVALAHGDSDPLVAMGSAILGATMAKATATSSGPSPVVVVSLDDVIEKMLNVKLPKDVAPTDLNPPS